ncbi:MAG: hypothetical protein KC466_00520 [Myxococcales bacterium]|nr:hypothetical protein [Myxococcales bacterium]
MSGAAGPADQPDNALEDEPGPLHLPEQLVQEVILSVGDTEAILIGGQALGLWADQLLDPEQLDELGGPVTSKDVDFFGTVDLARDLAQVFGGRVEIPDMDHVNTPEAAIVLYERDGRTVQIDILGCLAGLSNAEVQEGWVDLPYGSGEDEVVIRVMAPMEVLRSRISNIVILRRRDPNAIRQLRLSPHVVEAYIRQQLDRILSVRPEDEPDLIKGLQRSTQDLIRELIQHGRSQELDRIYLDHGVDLLAHALALSDHPAWEPRFADFQIRKAASDGITRRERRIAERERKDPGFSSARSRPEADSNDAVGPS